MAKPKIQYVCNECGHTSAKWLGNCPECDSWHTYEKVIINPTQATNHKAKGYGLDQSPPPRPLNKIDNKNEARFKSNIPEFDRTLGGGFVTGSFILVGGDPGIGKSTLTLQIAKANKDLTILYCAGEESAAQIKQRAKRLGVSSNNLYIYNDTDVSNIISEAQKLQPDLLIIDSIQTVYRTELSSMAGSIQQVKECAALFQQLAKKRDITTILIGHVTKQGDIAGPRVLEHMVDTVLQFEGDQNHAYRLLRTVKNRFGAAHEVGVFEMQEDGLKDVLNPSKLFLSGNNENVSGNAIICTVEGTRPMLIEVQALVTSSNYGMPQRTANGFDQRRLTMLLAVLEKRGGYQFSTQDVYLNIAGGIKLDDTAGDFGVMCALVSSLTNKPLTENSVFLGEAGLGGEIRAINRIDQRLSEIKKMGFSKAFIPKANQSFKDIKGLTVSSIENSIAGIEKGINHSK